VGLGDSPLLGRVKPEPCICYGVLTLLLAGKSLNGHIRCTYTVWPIILLRDALLASFPPTCKTSPNTNTRCSREAEHAQAARLACAWCQECQGDCFRSQQGPARAKKEAAAFLQLLRGWERSMGEVDGYANIICR